MEKIKELLKQLGASPEMQTQFIEHLENFQKSVNEEAEKTLAQRLQAAKEVCLEEVATEKLNLARKVEVFLESRISTINREAKKQAAIGESEAVKTLQGVKAMLEGIQVDGTPEDAQAAIAENKKLRVMCSKLQEEKASAMDQAKKANSIAIKALQRTKVMESKLQAGTVTESVQKPEAKPVAKPETLRTPAAKPATTRTVVTESASPKVAPTSSPEIMAIAESLDGNPAY